MTAARGRNAGWTAAEAPFVLFLDGDTQVHSRFVVEALTALAGDPAIAAVWGHRRESRPDASIYNRVLDLDWIYPPGWTEFFGGDVLIRREALLSVNGYNSELIAGEEPEMCRRLRGCVHQGKPWKILHIDAPMTSHDLRMTHFSQYWKRATRAGHAYEQVSGLFRGTPDPFWTAEARRNQARGLFWILLGIGAISAAVVLRSVWPIFVPVCLVLLAAVRSAWKVRDRSSSWSTLLLFGLHSHLQVIPIFFGQLRYRFATARKRKVSLIEYKRT
jgi:glycosyltransferase involved in cell wall biosynthesis